MKKYSAGLVLSILVTYAYRFGSNASVPESCVTAAPSAGSTPPAERMETPLAFGLIVPWGAWTPSRADVAALEQRLPEYLASDAAWRDAAGRDTRERWLLVQASLQSYARLYCGSGLRPRERHVWFTRSAERDVDDALEGPRVIDGGDAYFDVVYQPKARRFLRLNVHTPF